MQIIPTSESVNGKATKFERNEDQPNAIWLLKRSVKATRNASEQMVFDRIGFYWPSAPDASRELLEAGARSAWITLQGYIRKMTPADAEALDGELINAEDMVNRFGTPRQPSLLTRVEYYTSGTWDLEALEASLTPKEKEMLKALMAVNV